MKLFTVKLLTACFVFIGCTMAYAEGANITATHSAKWKEECGGCHIAYLPQLLTGNNWQQIMNGLDKHFGVNATLDARDSKEILYFLQRYAGSGDRHSATSLRISDTPWFTREHREVSNSVWSDPSVKSRANCTACHINAERGDWSEEGVRMPGGQRHERD